MTMNATFADFSAALAVPSARRTSPRIEILHPFGDLRPPDAGARYRRRRGAVSRLKAGLGRADIHYAVKANPAREIIERWSTSAPISTPPRAGRSSFASRSARDPRRFPSATP
jgi:hypothetical protein